MLNRLWRINLGQRGGLFESTPVRSMNIGRVCWGCARIVGGSPDKWKNGEQCPFQAGSWIGRSVGDERLFQETNSVSCGIGPRCYASIREPRDVCSTAMSYS